MKTKPERQVWWAGGKGRLGVLSQRDLNRLSLLRIDEPNVDPDAAVEDLPPDPEAPYYGYEPKHLLKEPARPGDTTEAETPGGAVMARPRFVEAPGAPVAPPTVRASAAPPAVEAPVPPPSAPPVGKAAPVIPGIEAPLRRAFRRSPRPAAPVTPEPPVVLTAVVAPPAVEASVAAPPADAPPRRQARKAARQPITHSLPESDAPAPPPPPSAAPPVQPRPLPPASPPPPEAPPGRARLGERLVQKGIITPQQLSEALLQQAASGKRLGALLLELGVIDERSLTATLAEQSDLEIADLRQSQPEAEALKLLPEAMARSLIAIPLRRTPSGLIIAVADPNPEVANELARVTKGEVTLQLAAPTEIRRSIDNFYRALVGVEMEIKAFQATAKSRETDTPLQIAVSEDAPIVKVVNLIITQGLRDRASDIHIEPQEDRLRIRFRIDGALHDVISLPSTMAAAVVSRLKILAGMNIVERQRSQDGQIAMKIDERQVDIRVATTSTIWGEKAVLRLLDKSKNLFHLQDLGMSPQVNEAYAKLIRSPFGMVICAGPTGSGKTTTLYATLNEVNNSERNVMTIEDPVEYVFPSINQIQIREQAGVTFAGGLKAILRQDPDVILVGEIRDAETARIAVQSALTGHFVLSSLHATDAASALHRFLDMGIESFLISASVTGLIGQRLLRRSCPECRVRYEPTEEEMAFYADGGDETKKEFSHGEGCNFCSKTGYLERIGVYELLVVTSEIKKLIVKGAGHEEIRSVAVGQGMRPMRSEALRLVEKNVTTIAEVMRTIYTL